MNSKKGSTAESRVQAKDTKKMILDAALLNTQHYKVRIKGKMEQPPLHLGVIAIEKGAFKSPSTKVTNFTLLIWL